MNKKSTISGTIEPFNIKNCCVSEQRNAEHIFDAFSKKQSYTHVRASCRVTLDWLVVVINVFLMCVSPNLNY